MLHEAVYALYEDAVSVKGNTVETLEAFDENGDSVSIVADDVTAKATEIENSESYKSYKVLLVEMRNDQVISVNMPFPFKINKPERLQ